MMTEKQEIKFTLLLEQYKTAAINVRRFQQYDEDIFLDREEEAKNALYQFVNSLVEDIDDCK